MDKETLSHYGWIVILVLVLSCMIALATPFGQFIARGFESTYAGFIYTNDKALGAITIPSGDIPVEWTGDWTWSFNEDGKTITLHRYIGADASTIEELVVPNKYRPDSNSPYYTVTRVESEGNTYVSQAADNPKGIIDVTKPMYCVLGATPNTTLKSLVISDGVEIGDGTAIQMSNLEKLTIGKNCGSEIGSFAFYNCKKLNIELAIPENIKVIDAGAFGMSGLTKVMVSKNVEKIGANAFRECSLLKGVDFTKAMALKSIGTNGFRKNFEIVEPLDFTKCINLESIGNSAFNGTTKVTSHLDFSNTKLKSIGQFAFAGTDYSAPTHYSGLTFSSCLEKINCYAFQDCQYFANELIFPDTLLWIGDGAFNHCMRFTNKTIVIPASVIQIGRKSFGDTSYQSNQPYGSHVFYNCATNTIEAFEVDDNNQHFTDVDGVLYSKDKTRLVFYPAAKKSTTYKVLDGVTVIDEMAFGMSGTMYRTTGMEANKLVKLILPDTYIINKITDDSILNKGYLNTLNASVYKSTIKEFIFSDTNTKYITANGCAYSKDMKTLYSIPSGSGDVAIQEGTEILFEGAFPMASCKSVYTFPSTLKQLSETVVDGKYENISINATLKEDGRQSKLITVIIPESNAYFKIVQDTTSATYPFYQLRFK